MSTGIRARDARANDRRATSYVATEQPPAGQLPRNAGGPLDLGWVRSIRINRSAVERRAATIPTRRSIKTNWQAGWLLRAVTLMDLTTYNY